MSDMTSLERMLRASNLEMPDRVPVAPYMGNHGAKIGGALGHEYCQSGELMAEAQFRAWVLYGQDAVVPQSDNYYIAEGFGIKVEHHHDGTPTLKTPVINELKDIERLKVPNPLTDGRMPVYLDAIGRLAKRVGEKVVVRAPGTGPLSLASHLMGTNSFLMELATAVMEPGGESERALRKLMQLTTEALIRFSRAALDAGAHMVQAGDSLASIDMISPSMYEQWAYPYEKMFFEEINSYAQAKGAMTLLHICGDMTPVLELMADTGAQILELDYKVKMREAKERVGDRVCIMGNINPSAVLLQGTPEEVRLASVDVIKQAGQKGGFILGSGCEVPIFAPVANLRAMIETASSFRYPF